MYQHGNEMYCEFHKKPVKTTKQHLIEVPNQDFWAQRQFAHDPEKFVDYVGLHKKRLTNTHRLLWWIQ